MFLTRVTPGNRQVESLRSHSNDRKTKRKKSRRRNIFGWKLVFFLFASPVRRKRRGSWCISRWWVMRWLSVWMRWNSNQECEICWFSSFPIAGNRTSYDASGDDLVILHDVNSHRSFARSRREKKSLSAEHFMMRSNTLPSLLHFVSRFLFFLSLQTVSISTVRKQQRISH